MPCLAQGYWGYCFDGGSGCGFVGTFVPDLWSTEAHSPQRDSELVCLFQVCETSFDT